jgi:hypothetical protein
MYKTSPTKFYSRSIRPDNAVASTQNFCHRPPTKREAHIPRVGLAEFQMHSVTPLNPPVCTTCDVVMIWYRSIRLEPNLVVRYFYCPKCICWLPSDIEIECAKKTLIFDPSQRLIVASDATLISGPGALNLLNRRPPRSGRTPGRLTTGVTVTPPVFPGPVLFWEVGWRIRCAAANLGERKSEAPQKQIPMRTNLLDLFE